MYQGHAERTTATTQLCGVSRRAPIPARGHTLLSPLQLLPEDVHNTVINQSTQGEAASHTYATSGCCTTRLLIITKRSQSLHAASCLDMAVPAQTDAFREGLIIRLASAVAVLVAPATPCGGCEAAHASPGGQPPPRPPAAAAPAHCAAPARRPRCDGH